MARALLEVKNLVTSFKVEGRSLRAVNDISFAVGQGKTLGIVGESGCGKSVASLSLMRLIQAPGQIESGEVWLAGQNLMALAAAEMQAVRGARISMIFQEAMTALNPVLKIGDQVSEVFLFHQPISRAEAWAKSVEMLQKVGIPSPEQRMKEYSYQLSGGMRQRVMIAMALACQPEVLIADEPTTALDVTIQMQILQLMKSLQRQNNMSIVFITHDLGVVAEMCDEVIVMYAGRVVEQAPVRELFKTPRHPYTQGLLNSLIRLEQQRGQLLSTIEGVVPSLWERDVGCSFHGRCRLATARCRAQLPVLEGKSPSHQVACFEAK